MATTTTIHLIFNGIPVDLTLDDLNHLDTIKAGLIQAKKLGFEGQPPMRSGFGGGGGGKGNKPAPATPVRDAAGRLGCPHHSGEKRGLLQKKEWSSGVVWACGCKDEAGQWCSYKLTDAQYQEFEQSVPKAAPATPIAPAPAQAAKPTSVEEAKQRFYARYQSILGGATWAHVQHYWKDKALAEPTTINGWLSEAYEINKREGAQTA